MVVGPGLVVTNAHNIRARRDGRDLRRRPEGRRSTGGGRRRRRPGGGGGGHRRCSRTPGLRRHGASGRGRLGAGQSRWACRTGQRRLRLRARRRLPGARRSAACPGPSSTPPRWRADRRAARWSMSGAPGRHRHPSGGRRLLSRASRRRGARARVDALSHGDVPVVPGSGSRWHPRMWRAGSASRLASPIGTGYSSTPWRRADRPIGPGFGPAISSSAWRGQTSRRSTSWPGRSRPPIPRRRSRSSWCAVPTR